MSINSTWAISSFVVWPRRGEEVTSRASYARTQITVDNRDYHQLSHSEIGGSIKGDVNKKASPSAGSREVFCLDIQPTVCRWLSIARAVLLWIALPFPRFIFE